MKNKEPMKFEIDFRKKLLPRFHKMKKLFVPFLMLEKTSCSVQGKKRVNKRSPLVALKRDIFKLTKGSLISEKMEPK